MDFFYFLLGLSIIYVVFFKRELLIQEESSRIFLGASVGLFLVGVILFVAGRGRYPMSGSLVCPLISLGLFRLLRRRFIKRYRREPQDNFLKWDAELEPDGFFNILYFTLAFVLTATISGLALRLADAGGW